MADAVPRLRKRSLSFQFLPSNHVCRRLWKGTLRVEIIKKCTPKIVLQSLTLLYCSNIASTHPWLVQRAQLDQAESEWMACQARVEEETRRVQQLTAARHSALEEIATLRQQQLERALQNSQVQQRREFAQQIKAQRLALEHQSRQLYNTLPPPQEDEEEPASKKRKLEQEEQVNDDKNETKSTENEETVPTEQSEPKPSDAKRKQLEASLSYIESMRAYLCLYISIDKVVV